MKKILYSILFFNVITISLAQESKNEFEVKYRRSSLYSVMVDQPTLPYAAEIKKNFENSPIPDKFNNHNLSKRVYDFGELPTDGSDSPILSAIARDIVAKWFNRSSKGGFNMNLIKERGFYDASALDVVKAQASKRGLDLLADAGEELIGKTFVLINEFKYTDKAEVAEKASGWLNAIGTIADYAGVSNVSTVTTLTSTGATVAGKGYIVKTNAHLYQLVWDEETAAIFYNDYWADDKTITPAKKKAFDESTIFKLKYIGTDTSWSDIQSTVFTSKSDEQLIERATVKAIDRVIVKLQKNHDQFKTKTPLYTVDPLTAKVGLKEGITNKSTFDVLEQVEDENGKTQYVKVGVVKVDSKYPIWDNTYGAQEENPNSTVDRTYFKKVSGKDFFPGMLLVQKKGK
ncbi:hypothetical protein [uncultured Flavobacterium sp.]|uniref:hypothetical protein n=1 Tax=uncultured Flavobacterium sp. TaxID=165435 RepID=UPI00260175C7|nr:hypothetical protein [uncultured Flavobacterium sp.]